MGCKKTVDETAVLASYSGREIRKSSSPSARKAFVYGYYGLGNFGDEAIKSIICQALARCGVESKFSTPWPQRREAVSFTDYLRRTIRRINQEWCDVEFVVLGGGGLIKDSSVVGGLSLNLALAPVWLQVALGRPLIIIGVGVGPLRDAFVRPWVRLLCQVASGVFVRDEMSGDELRACGVSDSSFSVQADLFFSEPSPGISSEPSERTNAVVALSIADLHWHCIEHNIETPTMLKSTADLVQSLLAAGDTSIQLAQFSAEDADFPWQKSFVEELTYRGITANLIDLSDATPGEMILYMSRAKFVLTSRYHAIASAAMGHAPIVVMPFDPKCANLANQLGITDAVVTPDELAAASDKASLPRISPRRPSASSVNRLREQGVAMVSAFETLISVNKNLGRPVVTEKWKSLEAVSAGVVWGAKRRLGRHGG